MVLLEWRLCDSSAARKWHCQQGILCLGGKYSQVPAEPSWTLISMPLGYSGMRRIMPFAAYDGRHGLMKPTRAFLFSESLSFPLPYNRELKKLGRSRCHGKLPEARVLQILTINEPFKNQPLLLLLKQWDQQSGSTYAHHHSKERTSVIGT